MLSNIMDKKWSASSVVILVLLSVSSIILVANANANANANTINNDGEEQSKKSGLWVWQRLRSAYSMYYSSIFPTSIGQYWHMAKTIVNHTYAYFFPPNIEYVSYLLPSLPTPSASKYKQKVIFHIY
jgi:hypothetical protein